MALPIKRFRCSNKDECGATFSIRPAFILVLKRYAAGVIQGAWEERVDERPRTLEEIAGRWMLPCVETIQRWLRPLTTQGEFLKRELRQDLPWQPPGRFDAAGTMAQSLLELARQVADHIPCQPFDGSRVPYHFVLSLLRR